MAQKKVIYVTTLTPSDVGHGGVHRSYQLLHDVEQIAGPDHVMLFTKHQLLEQMKLDGGGNLENSSHTSKLTEWATFRAGTAKRLLKNPYRIIQPTQFATGLHPSIRNYYEHEVKNLCGSVCVLEHAEFADLIPINRKYNISTISCTQNLDSFSQNFDLLSRNLSAIRVSGIENRRTAGIYASVVDFANELQILAECDERLFISKLETGLVGGLGLEAKYYPYVPVGAIRNRLLSIRQKRVNNKQEPGLFVLIGTATYGPIRKACEWFIENARNNGLPTGVRTVVAGLGTDTLLKPGEVVSGIELKGWVEQETMDELLVRARAVLVPQRFGFGVPTRIAELSCAGIPVIGDQHSTYALDPPPDFHVADRSWSSWYGKLSELSTNLIETAAGDYDVWESVQPRTLGNVVNRMLR